MDYDCPACQLKFNFRIRETLKLLRAAERKAKELKKHSYSHPSTSLQNCP
jgi:hypothetical protein